MNPTNLTLDEMATVDRLCVEFEKCWKKGELPSIEEFSARVDDQLRATLVRELVLLDVDYRHKAGESPSAGEYVARFPNYRSAILPAFVALAADKPPTWGVDEPVTNTKCPHCQAAIQIIGELTPEEINCPNCGGGFEIYADSSLSDIGHSVKTNLGRFELVEQVGIGAFGSVWRANDTELQRTVAVKIPRKGQLDKIETEQFLREARAAAKLRHPGIVSIHEIGRQRDTLYIVCDFVDGKTLAEWLVDHTPSINETVERCATIAEAVHHAHQHGVVHRDLKPSNIMLDADGKPYVMDFGLAKQDVGDITITVDGRILGTPAYMSPEQAKGMAYTADCRSDVYSLGVILFEMLTGRLPFSGTPRKIMHHSIHTEPPSLTKLNPAIPYDLELVCLRCLEKDPGKRYENCMELASDLRRFLSGEPLHIHPRDWRRRLRRWASREPTLAAHWVALGAALLATQISFTLFGEDLLYHLRNVTILLVWAAISFVMQKLANVPSFHRTAGILWAAIDPIFLTVLLYGLVAPRGPLFAGYCLMVVATGFFRRIRIIVTTTVVSLISFVILVWLRPEEFVAPEYCIAFGAILVVTGGLVAAQVRRTKKLSEF